MTQASSCGVDTDHGIHIAAGNGAGDFWSAEELERVGILPVRLGNDADTESVMFQ